MEFFAIQKWNALKEIMQYSEYVLIASRTLLPFNVFGMWKGGHLHNLKDEIAHYKEIMTNLEILSWLKGVLEIMAFPNPRKISRAEYYKRSVCGRIKVLTIRPRADYTAESEGYRQLILVFVSY